MKMQERIKMRSVSFSDEAPASGGAPSLPPRNRGGGGGTYRRQTSAESLPLYETDPIYGNTSAMDNNYRLNSLPRIMPHHRRKILDFNRDRPSSSLAGHYQYMGNDNAPDYANLTSISRRGAGYYGRSKDDYGTTTNAYGGKLRLIRH